MDRSRGLFSFILAFLGGVASESLFGFGYFAATVCAFLGALFILFFRKKNSVLFLAGLIFFAGAFGIFWSASASERLDRNNVWIGDGQKFEGLAYIQGDPVIKNDRLRVTLIPKGTRSHVLAYLPRNPRPSRGDLVYISGTFKIIENFSEDFDYVAYERARSVLYELYAAQIASIEPAPWYSVGGTLGRVRESFLGVFRRVLPEPHSALLGGITIGADEGLESLSSVFKTAGTSHIIVLSGYNITIVASVIQSVLVALGFWVALWGAVVGVILFTLMAGLSASAVRAALMAVIALCAKGFGREYDAGRALLFAVGIMVFLNPASLVSDASFQLSVLATLGILFGPDRVEPYCRWIPEKFGLRDAAVTTLAAQIFVLPFLLYQFGTLSLVSLPANVAILPLVPMVMGLGTIIGLLGLLNTTVAFILSFPVYGILEYMIRAATFFAAIPFASVSFGNVSLGIVFLLYGIIISFLFPEIWKRKLS